MSSAKLQGLIKGTSTFKFLTKLIYFLLSVDKITLFKYLLLLAESIAISSNYLIKFKKQIFSSITDYNNNKTIIQSVIENDKIQNNFLDNLMLLYERESFIMAFNKISYISSWTSIIPLLLLFFLKNKISYNK